MNSAMLSDRRNSPIKDHISPVHVRLPVWISVVALIAVACSGELSGGFTLPASHEVTAMANETSDSADFREVASEAGFVPLCAGGDSWQICLVQVDETLVVVPFNNPAGTQARITGGGLEGEVILPAEGNEPYGVRIPGGSVEVVVEDEGGNAIGGLEGRLPGT